MALLEPWLPGGEAFSERGSELDAASRLAAVERDPAARATRSCMSSRRWLTRPKASKIDPTVADNEESFFVTSVKLLETTSEMSGLAWVRRRCPFRSVSNSRRIQLPHLTMVLCDKSLLTDESPPDARKTLIQHSRSLSKAIVISPLRFCSS